MSSNALKGLVAVTCLAGTAMGIYNVRSDVGPVQGLAAEAACGAGGCAHLAEMHRSPFSQTFVFQVQSNSSRTERVVCSRSFLLVGEYSCERAR